MAKVSPKARWGKSEIRRGGTQIRQGGPGQPKGGGRGERRDYWQRLLRRWARSGLSQAEFCRRHRLKAVTFAWWKRQLRAAGPRPPREQSIDARARAVPKRRGRSPKTSGRFVEVLLGGASGASAYEVVLAGNRTIRIPEHFDPQSVSQLIAAVESC